MNDKKLLAEIDRLAMLKLYDVDKEGVENYELDFWPATSDIQSIGKYLADVHRLRKLLEERVEVLASNFAFASKIMAEKMDEAGMTNVTIPDAGSFKTGVEMFASIVADNKDAAYAWLEENGMGDLIKPTVNAASLKSALRGHIEEGGELPDPEVIRMYTQLNCKLTRLKK